MKEWNIQTVAQYENPLMKALAGGDVLFGTQAIVALNLADYSFPHWAAADQLEEVADLLRRVLGRQRQFKHRLFLPLTELNESERLLLVQRELMPTLPPGDEKHRYVLLDHWQSHIGVINGEEHLLLEHFLPRGIGRKSITSALGVAGILRDELACILPVGLAWDDEFQYLMSDPLRSGDGLGIAWWVNLPALAQTGDLESVREIVCDAGMQMRPAFGVTEKSVADVFRIDNMPAYGKTSLTGDLSQLRQTIKKICSLENKKRKKLLTQKRLGSAWEERLCHALEAMRSAAPVSEDELPGIFSILRLGIILQKLHANCTPMHLNAQLARAHAETQSGYMMLYPAEDGLPTNADARRGAVLHRLVTQQLQINYISTKN